MQAESLKKLDYVYQQLEHRITCGHWKIGQRIPTEAQLALEYHCSRGTVSKAVARLTHEGMVVRKTRAGTIVTRSTTDHKGPALDLNACAYIYPSGQHEGVWRIGRGFQQMAHQANRRTLMLTTGTELDKEAVIINRLAEFNVKGAIIYSVIASPQEQVRYAQFIQDCPFPVVLVELNVQGTGRPAIVADGLHAGYTVTQHLIERGARRISFLCNYSWAPYMRDRYLGYRQAMDEAALGEHTQTLVWPAQALHPSFDHPLEEPARIARQYLQQHPDLDGLVCSSDFLAHGCLRAARELGLSVPQQLKIVGIDDYHWLTPQTPTLTTYHIPYEEMGQAAFHCLEQGLRSGRPEATEQQLRGHLVVANSA